MMDTDQEIFASATSPDEAPVSPEPVTAPAPEAAPVPETPGQSRDERGRFAAPQGTPAEPEAPAAPVSPAGEAEGGHVPSWRLREISEARRLAEQRATDLERRLADMERQQRQPPKEQAPAPEIWDDPNAFVQQAARQALDPVQQRMDQLREFYSQREAVRTHGEEKVKTAFSAIDQAARAGDPDALVAVQRAKDPGNFDPYGTIVAWHQRHETLTRVGSDPEKWFEAEQEKRLQDPAYQARLLERIRGQAGQAPAGARPSTTVSLPPSLSRATSVAAASAEDADTSDAGLYRSALR